MSNSSRRAALRLIAVASSLVALTCLNTGSGARAAGTSTIEGVWSFNGGEVAVERQPDGTWAGTVVAATTFAECSHAVGEAMWKSIHAEADGSFQGYHQWFFASSTCVRNEQLGPTAWRVLEAKGGDHFLRACFSAPGEPQPEIALSGTSSHVGYGCVDSALVAPPPTTSGVAAFRRAVSLPSSSRCFSRRVFTIHLHDPRNDPLREAVVRLQGRRVRVVRRGGTFDSRIDLRGLPRGSFTIHIAVVTVLGHRLNGSRTYHTCRRRLGHGTKG